MLLHIYFTINIVYDATLVYAVFGLRSIGLGRYILRSMNLRISSMILSKRISIYSRCEVGLGGLHYRYTDEKYRLPLPPMKRHNCEQGLQERSVQDSEVECHR